MTYQSAAVLADQENLPKLPAWVSVRPAETPEMLAFCAGGALTVLDALVTDQSHGVPVKLLGNRLALSAATATSKLEGRLAREGDIRDAFHLTATGEARGPDGDLLAFWRDAARLRLNGKNRWQALQNVTGPNFEAYVEEWTAAGRARAESHGPLAGCVSVMREVLTMDNRAERVACLLSDIVLARAMNWTIVLPISARRMTKMMLRDLVADGRGGELAVQQRILNSLEDTITLARDLATRAAGLRSVAPKLRAKGSDTAIALFLSEDAVAPSTMLSPMIQRSNIPMTDRAARRFCDRLVELGVAHELTGRSTFRLYGIGL